MKRLTLVKICNSSTLGHLYEHLFYDSLIQFLTDKKLISRLDYFIHARTYEPGLIHVDIEMYTLAAQKLTQQFAKQRIRIDDAAVATALLQVMAESEVIFQGDKNVFKALADIDTLPWHDLSKIDTINMREQADNDLGIKRSDAASFEPQTLELTLVASPELPAKLTPLFVTIAQILLANLENSLMDTYGYYAFSERTHHTLSKTSLSSLLRASKQHRKALTDELETCRETIQWLADVDFTQRLHSYLVGLGKADEVAAPDELDIYDTTKVLVGRVGWRELAAEENIRRIMEHTTLYLVYGKERRELKLADIF